MTAPVYLDERERTRLNIKMQDLLRKLKTNEEKVAYMIGAAIAIMKKSGADKEQCRKNFNTLLDMVWSAL